MSSSQGRWTPDVQIGQVRAFLAVARLGSYERAAEHLSYSEPAIYAQIRKLESTLGLALVKRNRKQLILTREGARLLAAADQLVEHVQDFAHTAWGLRGKIVIAGGEYTAVDWVMPLVARYEAAHRDHSVEVHVEDPSAIIRGLGDGAFDIGMSGSLTAYRRGVPDLVIVSLARGTWVLAGDPSLAVRGRSDGFRPRVYIYAPLRSEMDRLLDDLRRCFGSEPEMVPLDTLRLVLAAAHNRLGLVIIPQRRAVTEGIPVVRPLGKARGIGLQMGHRRPALLSEAARSFVRFVLTERAEIRRSHDVTDGAVTLALVP